MFCAYTRPRYQVSVYRTIGPLGFHVWFIFGQKEKFAKINYRENVHEDILYIVLVYLSMVQKN